MQSFCVHTAGNFYKKLSFLQDDVCEDALDLSNGTLIIEDKWPLGTSCQWLLSIEDANSYITLEFHDLNVSILIL